MDVTQQLILEIYPNLKSLAGNPGLSRSTRPFRALPVRSCHWAYRFMLDTAQTHAQKPHDPRKTSKISPAGQKGAFTDMIDHIDHTCRALRASQRMKAHPLQPRNTTSNARIAAPGHLPRSTSRAVGLRTLHFFRSPPVVYRSNIRLLVVLGVIPDALKTAGCAQSRAVNDFVHTSTFLVNFGSVSSLFEVFQTCENLY